MKKRNIEDILKMRGIGIQEVLYSREKIESMFKEGYGCKSIFNYLKENNKITIQYTRFHRICSYFGFNSLVTEDILKMKGIGKREIFASRELIKSMLKEGYGYTSIYNYLKENNKISIEYSQFHTLCGLFGFKSIEVLIKELSKEGRYSDILKLFEPDNNDEENKP